MTQAEGWVWKKWDRLGSEKLKCAWENENGIKTVEDAIALCSGDFTAAVQEMKGIELILEELWGFNELKGLQFIDRLHVSLKEIQW